jgi:hypothetical protein
MKRINALLATLALILATTADATPQTQRVRCEKAQRELRQVEEKLAQVNPDYAGDLKREQALWEKKIRDNCYRSDWRRR